MCIGKCPIWGNIFFAWVSSKNVFVCLLIFAVQAFVIIEHGKEIFSHQIGNRNGKGKGVDINSPAYVC